MNAASLTVTDVKRFCYMTETRRLIIDLRAKRSLAGDAARHVASYLPTLWTEFSTAHPFYNDRTGELITDHKHLYTTDDDEGCRDFYAALDAAHKANGSTLPDGYCPHLSAESATVAAENALLAHACVYLSAYFGKVYNLDMRKQAIELLCDNPLMF